MKPWMWLALALILFLIGGYVLKRPRTPSPVGMPSELSPSPLPGQAEVNTSGNIPMQNLPTPRQRDELGSEPPRFLENPEVDSAFPGTREMYPPSSLDPPQGQEMIPPPPPPPPPQSSPEFFEGEAIEPPQYFDGEQEIPPDFEPPPPLEDDEVFIPPPMPMEPNEEPDFPVDR